MTTFYSFKGGVGRTMSLVNTAFTLAMEGRNVIVVDFDLEAPGLDTFNALKPDREVPGVIDFVIQYLETGQSPDAREFIAECAKIRDKGGKLWIMPSGRTGTYAANLNQIDWKELYENQDGFLLFEDLKAQWREELNPDYVLIDSRTGHSDTSGICTRQLPDAVVVFFFPNEQNLRGLVDVVADIREESNRVRKKDIAIHFVMSNVPDLDDEDHILANQIDEFKRQLGFQQDPLTVHRYDSLSLLNQVVFACERPKSRLAKEYRNIVREITVRNYEDRDGALDCINRWRERKRNWLRSNDLSEYDEILDKIQNAHSSDGEVLFHLGDLKEHMGDLVSSSELMDKAIDAGYKQPEAYLKRSSILEQSGDYERMKQDVMETLQFVEISALMLREALYRIIRSDAACEKEIVESPAIHALSPQNKIALTSMFQRSRTGMRIGVNLFLPLLQVEDLPESQSNRIRNNLSLLYMGLGRCQNGADIILNANQNINDMNIQDAFNYAMAKWGIKNKVESEDFQRVVELDQSEPDENKGPNYFQCMAIAHWAIGNKKTATSHIKQARQALDDRMIGSEFSCWSYKLVSIPKFLNDLDVIEKLIGGRVSDTPAFVSSEA
ncbi:MAG: ParA family protein [Gammaproteobacteria bacterium]|nr:ParA family protein [Gammaproteobacteria bacterium]